MRYEDYEKMRKLNVMLVLKDLHTSNSRNTGRKATSVLHRLTMAHDERKLQNAFSMSAHKQGATA